MFYIFKFCYTDAFVFIFVCLYNLFYSYSRKPLLSIEFFISNLKGLLFRKCKKFSENCIFFFAKNRSQPIKNRKLPKSAFSIEHLT